jgi:hypothetical protein
MQKGMKRRKKWKKRRSVPAGKRKSVLGEKERKSAVLCRHEKSAVLCRHEKRVGEAELDLCVEQSV